MKQQLITKFILNFNSESQPLVPEAEIRRVFQFLGLALICGKIDIPTFDQVVNGLITVGSGDFQIELLETKRKIKVILEQCERHRVS